tara:strand:+ start:150 stop:626 length:477 start_codon:yes stop_codon:yes gene_type:complete
MVICRIEREKQKKDNYEYIYGYDLWMESHHVGETYGGEDYELLQTHFDMVDRARFGKNQEIGLGLESIFRKIEMWCDDYVRGEDTWEEKLLEKRKVKPEDSIFDFLFKISCEVYANDKISDIWVPCPKTIEDNKIPVKKYLDDLREQEHEKDFEWGMN